MSVWVRQTKWYSESLLSDLRFWTTISDCHAAGWPLFVWDDQQSKIKPLYERWLNTAHRFLRWTTAAKAVLIQFHKSTTKLRIGRASTEVSDEGCQLSTYFQIRPIRSDNVFGIRRHWERRIADADSNVIKHDLENSIRGASSRNHTWSDSIRSKTEQKYTLVATCCSVQILNRQVRSPRLGPFHNKNAEAIFVFLYFSANKIFVPCFE